MLKTRMKHILQKLLGFDNYLFIFSLFTIWRMRHHQHEAEFVHFMKLIPNEGTILDIGANIGIMSVSLAQNFPNATVYSFEPMPQNLRAFKRIIRHFKLRTVRLFETALGEQNGQLTMVMPVQDKVMMQGLSHVVEDSHPAAEGITFKVPVKKLDEMQELATLPAIHAIKIDVENFEYPVLKGGKDLLLKHKPVIYCELWNNERRDLTLNYLKDLGYIPKVYDGKALVDYTHQDVANFILVPEKIV